MDSSQQSPTTSIPSDEDRPFEVREWIASVLLEAPAVCSDEEADTIAGKFHGTGWDLKTATIGDLQSPSCLGIEGGQRVFERVDNSQGTVGAPGVCHIVYMLTTRQFESMLSSIRKTTKASGLDLIPANAGSATGSRKTSVVDAAGQDSQREGSSISTRHSRHSSRASLGVPPNDTVPDVRRNSAIDLNDGADVAVKRRRGSSQGGTS